MRVGLVCRWFGGGSRLASEVRESSVVFKSRLGAVWGRSLSPVAIRYESWGLPFKAQYTADGSPQASGLVWEYENTVTTIDKNK